MRRRVILRKDIGFLFRIKIFCLARIIKAEIRNERQIKEVLNRSNEEESRLK